MNSSFRHSDILYFYMYIFVLKFFRGGTRATAGGLAGNFSEIFGQRLNWALFTEFILENSGFFVTVRFLWTVAVVDILLFRVDV